VGDTITGTLILTTMDCCSCGVVFAAPEVFVQKRRESGENFYCPNGHSLCFRDSEVKRLRRQAEQQAGRLRHLEDQRDAAERSRSALRGVNTRLRRRVAAGVCPCCNRSFQDLARHMAGQHPTFGAEVSA